MPVTSRFDNPITPGLAIPVTCRLNIPVISRLDREISRSGMHGDNWDWEIRTTTVAGRTRLCRSSITAWFRHICHPSR